jgi:hypothetical protein
MSWLSRNVGAAIQATADVLRPAINEVEDMTGITAVKQDRYKDRQIGFLKEKGVTADRSMSIGQLHDMNVVASQRMMQQDLEQFRKDNPEIAPTKAAFENAGNYGEARDVLDQAAVIFGQGQSAISGTPEEAIVREAQKNSTITKLMFSPRPGQEAVRPGDPSWNAALVVPRIFNKQGFKESVKGAKKAGEWKAGLTPVGPKSAVPVETATSEFPGMTIDVDAMTLSAYNGMNVVAGVPQRLANERARKNADEAKRRAIWAWKYGQPAGKSATVADPTPVHQKMISSAINRGAQYLWSKVESIY